VGEIYPYLGRVLGILLEQEAAERLERLDGESLKWQTFRGVQEWLHTLARRGPLVLVFDNLHWIDPISAELLDQVIALAEQTAVLIIGVYRPEPDSLAWRLREATRQQANLHAEIWLRPLPQRATEHMVRHMLVDAPQPVLDLAWQRTEGNPLFVEEIVRSMVDQHVLVQRHDGVWELASGWAQANIPNTVHGILQSRVDRLDAEARRALQVAACIGRRFPYALLAIVGETVGVPAARLDPCLRALEQATLIQREGAPSGAPESGRETESPVREYSFKYMLIRDIAHGNLLKSARSQIHTAIAQWYEVNALSSPEPPYGLLAYHYEQTDNIKQQQHYLRLAGQQAARVYANQEAYTCFAKALVLAREPAERFDLLQACERVLEVLGDRAQQQSSLEELLDLANQLEDNQRRAIVYNRMAALHASQGEYTSALQVAKEGQAAAHQSGDSRAETESLQIIASTAWRQGRFEAALDAAQAAVALARAVDDVALEATSLTTMGIIHRSMGDLDSARAGYEQALAIRRSAGDQRGEAISLNQLGNLCYDRGDYSGALEHYRPALDLFRKVGDRRGEAWSLSGLGTIYLRCGDCEAARASYQEALSLRRMVRDQRGEAVTLADLGNALAGLGELEAARAHLEQAVSLTRSLGAHRDEVYALTYLARALEKSGDWAGAEAAHQSALAARQAQKQHAGNLENLAGLARIALERQAQEQARAHVEEILSTMREHGWLAAESPFLVYQTCVRVLQAAGDEAGARETLSTAWRTLGDWADRIADPLLRQSFLERVPENRDLRALWREASGA
jgi:tetratricopeptide (TPR) repeat protein